MTRARLTPNSRGENHTFAHWRRRKSDANLSDGIKIDAAHRHHAATSRYWASEHENLILHE
jgi:hypothetical protein